MQYMNMYVHYLYILPTPSTIFRERKIYYNLSREKDILRERYRNCNLSREKDIYIYKRIQGIHIKNKETKKEGRGEEKELIIIHRSFYNGRHKQRN